ncbi:MAG: hypothetical protein JWR25_2102 [Noviherbaspirillum sp.]|nr:hypothetical protein [Noviherbaspirillum sp.]
MLFLLCIPVVANLLVRPLERFAPALTSPTGTGARAIVVLAAGRISGAPEYDMTDIPDLIALPRLRYAAKLHNETALPILVSGGGSRYGEPLAIGMARALNDEFATPVRWIEGESFNTAENAELSARILHAERIRRILLVTDAMHMPRAVMAFARAGFEVAPAPTIFFSNREFEAIHLIPSVEGLRRSHYAVYEWLGIIWYFMQYRNNERQILPEFM